MLIFVKVPENLINSLKTKPENPKIESRKETKQV